MAKQEERIGGALQENLLTMLCFSEDYCKIIRAAVTPQLFDSAVFREVAGHAIDFIDQYGEPVKEHLADHLEHILHGEDKRKATSYERLLQNMYDAKDSINGKFVMDQLHAFVRLQRFKSGLADAIESVKDGKISEAELAMQKAMKSQAVAFDPGFDFSDAEAVGTIFDNPEEEGFDLGIPEFDERGIKPRRRELFALIAPRKRGKSWFITHCSKQALLQRWSALVVTLELTEKSYSTRMLQSFFSVTRREAEVQVTTLKKDRDGHLESLLRESIERKTMKDSDTRAGLVARAKREFKRRKGFKIKEFPMHSLTIPDLEAYLDGLERFEGFTPDVIFIDYPRIMKHDAKNLRIELGQTFAQLRGIAQTRNCAMVIVHQSNRDSEKASLVTSDMAEEDISIVAAVDVAMTYSQTKQERKLGLARLYADYVRNGSSQIQVLITQGYAMGQFCLDSVRIDDDYWEMMNDRRERDERRGSRNDDEKGDENEQRKRA
jgi:hypothetical protein